MRGDGSVAAAGGGRQGMAVGGSPLGLEGHKQ